MRVSELMTRNPVTCSPETNLAEAAALMLRGDCGILPVVSDGALCGVVTDRDLFIALGTRDRKPSSLTVSDVVTGEVFACSPDDDVEDALDTMKQHAIRRVPVLGFGGAVIGIVSLNDLALAAGRKNAVHGVDLIETLKAICAHHHPTRVEAA